MEVQQQQQQQSHFNNKRKRQELWGHAHLPLLTGANSKDSVEYILQALWRTHKTGLDATDRSLFRDMLHLSSDSDLDPLLACLRILIRKSVYENIQKDEIQNLFPKDVLPELQKLLTLLLQKFQQEWREDVLKDQESLPRLKAMTWDLELNNNSSEPGTANISLKLSGHTKSLSGENEVRFNIAKDSLDTMLKSMYLIRDQMSNNDDANVNGQTGDK